MTRGVGTALLSYLEETAKFMTCPCEAKPLHIPLPVVRLSVVDSI
jgi:hypothetical protein